MATVQSHCFEGLGFPVFRRCRNYLEERYLFVLNDNMVCASDLFVLLKRKNITQKAFIIYIGRNLYSITAIGKFLFANLTHYIMCFAYFTFYIMLILTIKCISSI